MFIPAKDKTKTATTDRGDKVRTEPEVSRADRLPDALLGERPVGRVERLGDLDTAADDADERTHDEAHQQARRTLLELAAGLRGDDDVGEQREHAGLERTALVVEVRRVMV